MKRKGEEEFYGTTTLGEKGQIVVPAEARRALKLKKGEKMLVFGMGDMIACAKLEHVQKFATKLAKKATIIRTAISKASNK
jgi:AbrB family looped-hinge helix DNA binding protein